MSILKKEAKFLTLLAGRGYFYIVLGTLLMAQWPDVGNFLLGLYMTCVGGLMTVVGLHAKAKMDKMKGHIKDETAVVAVFKKADVDQVRCRKRWWLVGEDAEMVAVTNNVRVVGFCVGLVKVRVNV
jgi:hypothetical protein